LEPEDGIEDSGSLVRHSMIGQILQSFGRITEQDVENALAYQQSHGGYFGEALLGLGLVNREELDWGLASQFDIPYVIPDADSIDLEAAALVTPEWALANLTLPILKTAETLTVIVDTPIWSDAVEELKSRTRLQVELGLASSSRIRELIREVYAERLPAVREIERHEVQGLEAFIAEAVDARAARFGVSVRGGEAVGWFEGEQTERRRTLDSAWNTDLENLMSRPPFEARGASDQDSWIAEMVHEGKISRVNVHYLAGGDGEEYVFETDAPDTAPSFDPPRPTMLAEIRMLVESGSARFVVTTTPESLGPRILHHLPEILLEGPARSVAVTDSEQVPTGVFARTVPPEEVALTAALQGLRKFRFEAVSADLSGNPTDWVDQLMEVAQTVFVLWNAERDRQVAHVAGVRWHLKIDETLGDRLEWVLHPLRI
jgi:hypothetical protein